MFFFFLNICAEFIDRRKVLVLQTRHGEEVGTFTILSIHLYGHLCLSWKHPREVRKGCARKVSLGIMATIWLYHEAVVLLKNSHIEDKRTASFQLSHVSFFFFFFSIETISATILFSFFGKFLLEICKTVFNNFRPRETLIFYNHTHRLWNNRNLSKVPR